mmetsp:Transcript_6424/g.11118  ORF Transcript_6424/g.11118 Transcript_6424/m.11118 type:complete len:462 (+) Transcript_6424:249-1634(+)|eukprot:CAMPEP_0203749304 /NCGR_PEP_ID=MMETSP0098-20131031/3917_1 /ASSEMBLY_ACC=CAM_ASM_000208 /TAXON_ID=96639 /ORGANISM=" , Strain NY0313808BC1" /LENGTH=461 /DNA_ID=CAMNT_0050638329 /DNA_START=2831 /DNA_END=4216 /DNA_ORIENTATION=+
MKVIRKADAIELVYARIAAQCNGAFSGGIVIGLSGKVDTGVVKSAIRKMEARHPMLRSGLSPQGEIVERDLGEGQDGIYTVFKRIERKGDDHWKNVVDEIVTLPLEYNESPFMFVLINGEESSELLLRGQHLFGDAQSLVTLAHEFLETIGTPERNWEPRSEVVSFQAVLEKAIPFSVGRLVLIIFGWVFFILRAIMRRLGLFNVSRVPSMDKAHEENLAQASFDQPPPLAYSSLLLDQVDALKRIAKESGVGFNSLLSGAAMGAIADVANDTTPLRTIGTITFDARLRIGSCIEPVIKPADVGNYSSGFSISPTVQALSAQSAVENKVSSIWKTIYEVDARSKGFTWLEMMSTTLPLAGLLDFFPIVDYENGNSCVLANWGRIPIVKKYGKHEIRFLKPFLNTNSSADPYISFMSTHLGMELMVSGTSRLFNDQIMEDLVRAVRSRLLLLISASGMKKQN